MSKQTDNEVMVALIHQVSKAARQKSEIEVTTFITKPMWKAFCRATGMSENSLPGPWDGIKGTRRVYGSKTIIVPGKSMTSMSFCIHIEKSTQHR